MLKIVAQEGVPARVGEVLAFIGKPGEFTEIGGSEHRAAEPAPTPKPGVPVPAAAVSAPPIAAEVGFISPVVARIAAEHGIDLSRRPRDRPEWPHHQE